MSTSASALKPQESSPYKLGISWIGLWLALAVHVTDEALTGFLSVYNPTVVAMHAKLGFWPMPTFTFREWLAGLSLGIAVLAMLSPFAFRNARWLRPLFYFCAVVLAILNAIGHTLGTILGHTVESVRFARPAPGLYSSPLLFLAGCFALVQLRRTRNLPTL
ncbi:MAG: hypothetical protein JOZ10_19400 [Acidobacteria bacterium]|nr:hypothetical protein [Acidobacteriota bacterium]MBV9145437.1 hypothetical protein [Acidobacteriota bacterium]MBV9436266.1 hypothetical protein [Acidobacteriota bacterium]